MDVMHGRRQLCMGGKATAVAVEESNQILRTAYEVPNETESFEQSCLTAWLSTVTGMMVRFSPMRGAKLQGSLCRYFPIAVHSSQKER